MKTFFFTTLICFSSISIAMPDNLATVEMYSSSVFVGASSKILQQIEVSAYVEIKGNF